MLIVEDVVVLRYDGRDGEGEGEDRWCGGCGVVSDV